MFKHVGTQTIETERLVLRKFKDGDVDDVYNNWASNPKIQLEYGEPVYSTKEQAKGLLDHWIFNYKNDSFYRWAIILKNSDKNIGQIAFCRVYEEVATAEIEYCIGENYWGNRYALEALNALIDYIFLNSDFEKLEAFYRKANPKSGKVLEKTVMKIVPTVRRFELLGEIPDGEICYAITKEEYGCIAKLQNH
jgi:ribosomal-protein-alanine N-acetyltransferase